MLRQLIRVVWKRAQRIVRALKEASRILMNRVRWILAASCSQETWATHSVWEHSLSLRRKPLVASYYYIHLIRQLYFRSFFFRKSKTFFGCMRKMTFSNRALNEENEGDLQNKHLKPFLQPLVGLWKKTHAANINRLSFVTSFMTSDRYKSWSFIWMTFARSVRVVDRSNR